MRLQQLVDTKQNWVTQNKVLLKGEVSVCSDVPMRKVGDGTSVWNDLPASVDGAFDNTVDQDIAVLADGGKTFSFDASSGEIYIAAGTTNAQIAELFDTMPKGGATNPDESVKFVFGTGTHTVPDGIKVYGFSYSITLIGETYSTTLGATQSSIIDPGSSTTVIRTLDICTCMDVSIIGLEIHAKHVNSDNNNVGAVYTEHSSLTLKNCYLKSYSTTVGYNVYSYASKASAFSCTLCGGRQGIIASYMSNVYLYSCSTSPTKPKYGISVGPATIAATYKCSDLTGSTANSTVWGGHYIVT